MFSWPLHSRGKWLLTQPANCPWAIPTKNNEEARGSRRPSRLFAKRGRRGIDVDAGMLQIVANRDGTAGADPALFDIVASCETSHPSTIVRMFYPCHRSVTRVGGHGDCTGQ